MTWVRGAILLACFHAIFPTRSDAAATPPLQISLDAPDPRGFPRLRVQGDASLTPVLQTSTDLRHWYTATDPLTLTGGGATFQDSMLPVRSTFYRAVVQAAPLDVRVQTDPRATVLTLVGTNGGSAVLRLAQGVEARLSLPASAVDGDTLVRMTCVSNLVGAPTNNGIPATVLLEPEGLALLQPATLEFIFPTNTPPAVRGLRGFASGGDGTDLHLAPVQVRSNVVSMTLTHFSAWDIRSLSEAQTAAAIARQARTSRGSLERDMAADLAEAGDLAAQGLDPDGSAGLAARQRAGQALAEYYHRRIAPHLGESDRNCPLAKFLMRDLASVIRQRALLGLGDDAVQELMVSALADHVGVGIENCIQTVLEKCAAGARSQEAVNELLGLVRQAELLGYHPRADVARIIESCMPAAWTGTLLYQEKGATNEVVYDPGFSQVRRVAGGHERSFNLKVDARVESVTETLAGGFQNLTLRLVAPTTGSQIDRYHGEFEPVCEGSNLFHPPGAAPFQNLDLALAETNRFDVIVFLMAIPGAPGLTNVTINYPSPNLSGRFIDRSRPDTPDCRTAGIALNISEARAYSPQMPAYSQTDKAYVTRITTNELSISGAGTRSRNGLPTHWTLEAQFHRIQ